MAGWLDLTVIPFDNTLHDKQIDKEFARRYTHTENSWLRSDNPQRYALAPLGSHRVEMEMEMKMPRRGSTPRKVREGGIRRSLCVCVSASCDSQCLFVSLVWCGVVLAKK